MRTVHGVFHRGDRYGRGPWRVIVRSGDVVRHLAIPETDEATTKAEAESAAAAMLGLGRPEWSTR